MTKKPTSRTEATLGLVFVALLWGITFPLIRSAVQSFSPSYFVAIRFTLAALALAPFVFLSTRRRAEVLSSLPVAVLLGAVLYTTFMAQTIGLETVSAPRAAFLTGTYVLFVPFFSVLFHRTLPGPADVVGSLLATLGMYFLVDPSLGGVQIGDVWILLCAIGVALHLHALQYFYRRGLHELSLAFLQVAGVAFFAVALMPFSADTRLVFNYDVVIGLAVCALLVTVGTFWLHSRYQRVLSAEKASIVFALEPVFASVFGYWILGEELKGQAAIGAALIAGALAISGVFAQARWPGLSRNARLKESAQIQERSA